MALWRSKPAPETRTDEVLKEFDQAVEVLERTTAGLRRAVQELRAEREWRMEHPAVPGEESDA